MEKLRECDVFTIVTDLLDFVRQQHDANKKKMEVSRQDESFVWMLKSEEALIERGQTALDVIKNRRALPEEAIREAARDIALYIVRHTHSAFGNVAGDWDDTGIAAIIRRHLEGGA